MKLFHLPKTIVEEKMDDKNFNNDSEDRDDRKNYKTKYRTDYPANFKFDYKDPVSLSKFLYEGGRIVPARVSKLSYKQQKSLNRAIKKARQLALLPVGTLAYDTMRRPNPVSPKPFEY